MDGVTRGEVLGLVVRLAAVTTLSYFTMKILVDALDPTKKQKIAAQKRAQQILSSLGIPSDINLTEYELLIASQLVDPSTITVGFEDIAGLEQIVTELRQTVILPIQKRDLFCSSALMSAPKGVLLHGPPGCGKTMIAKATAREAGARFLNLDISSLTDKWYGESQKLAGAVFTLATKIQPCIIFIDEIDSLLRVRDQHDHEATAMIKAQFMQLWDGLTTDNSCTVLVMGATNRPNDVDKAILRRMPATFRVGLPSAEQRRSILTTVLRMEVISDCVDTWRLAKLTEGFSGSDLRELCRSAAVCRVYQLKEDQEKLDPINMEDLLTALAKMRESKIECGGSIPRPPDLD
ncbi:ATPase family AAA domain-containing protein 1-B [Eurytemora carolleeae]|uniref:ATPase family AAA domain-containing protein 1-B n=1 Tax=Eurytemora carolleeae TaxID=1294199 RepID=UPI000C77CB02|nr:ATPase family AAA domain-containing protein 1-B [Eurytemora carolleeae]|eukprot:XP_023329010.1 ATPase family AAA domain-containing protein 1-B-like [Eurytemora affinis]